MVEVITAVALLCQVPNSGVSTIHQVDQVFAEQKKCQQKLMKCMKETDLPNYARSLQACLIKGGY